MGRLETLVVTAIRRAVFPDLFLLAAEAIRQPLQDLTGLGLLVTLLPTQLPITLTQFQQMVAVDGTLLFLLLWS
jgi:hypothetical protein